MSALVRTEVAVDSDHITVNYFVYCPQNGFTDYLGWELLGSASLYNFMKNDPAPVIVTIPRSERLRLIHGQFYVTNLRIASEFFDGFADTFLMAYDYYLDESDFAKIAARITADVQNFVSEEPPF